MKNSNFWSLIIIILVIGVFFGFIYEKPYTYRGSLIDPAVEAPDFTLKSSQGGEYHLKSRSGNYILIFFGYTYCPDVCPATLFEMRQIKQKLNDKADNIDFVFITVDPDRDIQEQLSKYLASFDESFYGLTGSTEELTKVWKDYGVYREIQPVDNFSGYLVDHTSRLYLINSNNELLMTYLFETSLEDIVSDLNYLMKKDNS